MTIDELAKQIFAECEKDGEPVTIEEAREMAQMEIGAKDIKNYTQSAEMPIKKDKKPKEIKVSDEKVVLFSQIVGKLTEIYGENVQIVRENKEIALKVGGKSFKIDLIEHRVPKAKGKS